MDKLTRELEFEKRLRLFAVDIIKFCKSIKESTITRPIVSQIVRSGTSVGANYVEANSASSRKDFRNKIFICKKEIQETNYWLKLLVNCVDDKSELLAKIMTECNELCLIFQKIVSTMDQNDKINNKIVKG